MAAALALGGFTVLLLSLPFVGAFFLGVGAKRLNFTRLSYLIALQSMLIAVCAMLAVGAVLSQFPADRVGDSSASLKPLHSFGPALVVCVIAVTKLSRESVWKSLGAVGLSLVASVLYFTVLANLILFGRFVVSPVDLLRYLSIITPTGT